jgi:hypothetical protein
MVQISRISREHIDFKNHAKNNSKLITSIRALYLLFFARKIVRKPDACDSNFVGSVIFVVSAREDAGKPVVLLV